MDQWEKKLGIGFELIGSGLLSLVAIHGLGLEVSFSVGSVELGQAIYLEPPERSFLMRKLVVLHKDSMSRGVNLI